MNVFVAVMQLLVAAAFVSIPLGRHRYGPAATASAEAELERQGVRPTILAENGMRFDAGGHETAVPVAVAAVMVALAGLNLYGGDLARPLTWVFQSIVLLGNCLILYSNLTAVKSVQAAFLRKGDPMLARVDVRALLKAAEDGFPAWTWILQNVRHVVVFGASILALAVPFAV
ncbi:hypothetical protein GCM10023194_80410 [Planotetraspora phitsanulokensis]|uniref:Uncharacterized protein n=1 Tax=Planotetraspora phitsanulokensis TaxID=575192 RepID=A0A8J3XHZ3_9ACTN|nr:hypothetical protein [Planotetraspora phitsanulokensis]GII41630.1 hypothetical protein Pph01_66330 [Planotetraspora phitsanulokensis]